jgi:hypothetical protein
MFIKLLPHLKKYSRVSNQSCHIFEHLVIEYLCTSHVHLGISYCLESCMCVLMGFNEITYGYKCYDLTTKKMFTSWDVCFDQHVAGNWTLAYVARDESTIFMGATSSILEGGGSTPLHQHQDPTFLQDQRQHNNGPMHK